jgi:hypothetical protein
MKTFEARKADSYNFHRDSLALKLARKLRIPTTPRPPQDVLIKSVLNKASEFLTEKELHLIGLRLLPVDGKLRTNSQIEVDLGLCRNDVSMTISMAIKRPLTSQLKEAEPVASLEGSKIQLDAYSFNDWNNANWTLRHDMDPYLLRSISNLPGRHRQVVQLRFGFNKEGFHTLVEAGNKMGLSNERVRQIEEEALAQLRRDLNIPKILDTDKESPAATIDHAKIASDPVIKKIVKKIRKEADENNKAISRMVKMIRKEREEKMKSLNRFLSPEAKAFISRMIKESQG